MYPWLSAQTLWSAGFVKNQCKILLTQSTLLFGMTHNFPFSYQFSCLCAINLMLFYFTFYVQIRSWQGTYEPEIERSRQLIREEIKPLRAYPFIYLILSIFPLINRYKLLALYTGGTLKPDIHDDRSLWNLRLPLQYADPRTPFPCPVSPNADGVGATNTRTGIVVHGNSSIFHICSRVWLNPLTLHSATQWG